METLLQDIRFGMRNLGRTRGLTVVAIVTLALGIGANTAIFSVIDAVLLRPLPFRQPGQLVRLYETESAPGNYPFAPPDFLDWKSQNTTFQDMALFGWGNDMNLSENGRSERVIGLPTEANFFSLLGVQAMLGRTWAPDEDKLGKEQVCILSYPLWQSHFGGDAGVINRAVELNAKPYTIIGVMPPGFRYPSRAQLWVPQPMDLKSLGNRGSHWASAIGRLKPGVTVEQAQAELTVIARRLEEQYPDSNYKVGAKVVPLHEDLVGRSRNSLLMMLWAVALVLLIACANVANLLLSRSVARQKEMAIRSALGAARKRLVRQLLTESVLLGIAGAALGLLVAYGGIKLLANARALGIPATNPVTLNLPVLGFTLGIAVLTGLLFGVIPALQMSRPDLHDELKGGAGSSLSPTRRRRLASNGLVIAEVGLSLLLLISAGLLLKDFLQLRNQNIGIRSDGVWTGAVRLPDAKYKEPQQRLSFSQALLEKVRQLPGVESAALTSVLPLQGGSNSYVYRRGDPKQKESGPLVEYHTISPGYFRTMGIPLLGGRDLTAEDVERTMAQRRRVRELYEKNSSPPRELLDAITYPVVINQAMARHFWPEQNAVGQMFSTGEPNGPWREVIGVVGDVRQWGLAVPPQPEEFEAFSGEARQRIVVHAAVPPASLSSAVRQAVAQIDPSLPLFGVGTMDDVIAEAAAGEQFVTSLLGLFAGLALLLAAVGIYGVLSYMVTQRTREIGIRISLGASGGAVLRLVLGQGFRLALWGFALGIGGALAARKVLTSALHTTKPHDPLIYVATVACLAAVALLACYIPARRAAKVDPMVALRYE